MASNTSPPDDVTVHDATALPVRRGLLIRLAIASLVALIVIFLAVGQYLATRSDGGTQPPDLASRQVPTSVEPTTTEPTTTTLPPTTTTTIPPIQQPPPVALPPPPGGSVKQGDRAAEIMGYEARLYQLKFDPGPVDGVFDAMTRTAVEAFDKLMNWPRDGVIDQPFVDALSTFLFPTSVHYQAEADRVEIDLDRQIVTVYKGWQVVLIAPTSTGNGERFCTGNDGCHYAVTPAGKYAFTRHVNGWRNGDLGRLYNPWYFNGGIALHGYSSVPVTPASHGCARLPMHVAEYIGTLFYEGMVVYVDGTQAPDGGYPPGSPNGGSASVPAPPTTPPPTAPPETAPPPPDTTTLPPETTTTLPPETTTTTVAVTTTPIV